MYIHARIYTRIWIYVKVCILLQSKREVIVSIRVHEPWF